MTEGTVHHTDTEGTEIKCPAPVIPAQAGTYLRYRHRPSPVWRVHLSSVLFFSVSSVPLW
jgi:hypothetical protein